MIIGENSENCSPKFSPKFNGTVDEAQIIHAIYNIQITEIKFF